MRVHILWPVLLFMVLNGGFASADSLTMTTYYPAPSGNYVNLTTTGNVGIGTSAPRGLLDVNGVYDIYLSNSPIIGTGQSLYLPGHIYIAPYGGTNVSYLQARRSDDTGTTALRIRTYNSGVLTEAVHIAGDGSVGIGVLAPTYKLQLNGQPAANGYTAWTNYSDARLKENVADMIPSGQKVLDKVGKLRPVTFNYNALTGYDEKTRARRVSGFIAQELQPLFPEMVGETAINGGKYLDTDLSNLPLYLVVAVKELRQEIAVVKADALKELKDEEAARSKELRAENDVLRKEMKELRADLEAYKKRHK